MGQFTTDCTSGYTSGIMQPADMTSANDNFILYYSATFNGGSVDFTKPLQIDFTDLTNKANAFYGTLTPPSNAGITLIHRFTADKGWFITLEFCTIGNAVLSNDPAGRMISNITSGTTRYDIYPGNTALNTPSSMLTGYIDINYFNSMMFSPTATASTPGSSSSISILDPANMFFVKQITFPWVEIQQLYADNNDHQTFTTPILSLISCASSDPALYGDACMTAPHSIWMYMADGATNRLGTQVSSCSFANMACDVGGMCPPRCGLYYVPINHAFPQPDSQTLLLLLHTKALADIQNKLVSMEQKLDQL